MTQPYDVEFASELYQDWLSALKKEASLETHNQAQAMMRAVMHELRGSIQDEAVLEIANAFPALARGVFLEGWRLGEPFNTPVTMGGFHQRLCLRLSPHHIPPENITQSVFAVWRRKLPPAGAQTIASCLPQALKEGWPE